MFSLVLQPIESRRERIGVVRDIFVLFMALGGNIQSFTVRYDAS